MKTLIKGGRVVDPSQGLDQVSDVLIDDGVVARVSGSIEADDATVLDSKGLIVCPGLIDMHVHLREPGREDEETIETGARAAIAGGFTSIACMPNTEPVIEGDEGVKFVLAQAQDANLARVYPVAALSRGLKGETLAEMGTALKAGAVGVSDDGRPVTSSALMRRALEYVKMFGRPVFAHCEDLSLSANGVMNEGRMSTLLGLKGMPPESESVMVARDIMLTELARSRLHVCHVSTGRSVALIKDAKASGVCVTCEVTPHHFALTDEAVRSYDTNAKMNPPLRDERNMAALRQALRSGLVDAIATDHAPHSPEEKDQEFNSAPFGVVGLETALGLACTCLYHEGIITLPALVRLMSTNPAGILGIAQGTLKEGSPGDITVFDPDCEWTVDPTRFHSKSRNTPFSDWKLKGRAVSVIVGGRVLMRDGELG
ncbi:MAG: dihydroorotase [Candidatus Eisenbacteria bacterium]